MFLELFSIAVKVEAHEKVFFARNLLVPFILRKSHKNMLKIDNKEFHIDMKIKVINLYFSKHILWMQLQDSNQI